MCCSRSRLRPVVLVSSQVQRESFLALPWPPLLHYKAFVLLLSSRRTADAIIARGRGEFGGDERGDREKGDRKTSPLMPVH